MDRPAAADSRGRQVRRGRAGDRHSLARRDARDRALQPLLSGARRLLHDGVDRLQRRGAGSADDARHLHPRRRPPRHRALRRAEGVPALSAARREGRCAVHHGRHDHDRTDRRYRAPHGRPHRAHPGRGRAPGAVGLRVARRTADAQPASRCHLEAHRQGRRHHRARRGERRLAQPAAALLRAGDAGPRGRSAHPPAHQGAPSATSTR